MQTSTHTLSLESILIFSRDQMQQLLQLLNNETEALKNKHDLDELERITLEKIKLSENIEVNEQQRIHYLNEKNLEPNKPKQWLTTNKLISIWQEIKLLSEKSQKQNLINGLVINGNRRRIQAQLEILNVSPAVELAYSSSGESIKQKKSTTLVQV